MDDNIKTLDIMSLPEAKKVEEGDTVLLMRQGEDGTKECLRVDRATLCKTPAKRVKRYVIGRAIAPKSCMDTGHENWYCFGYGYGSGYGYGYGYGYGSGYGSGSGSGSGFIRFPLLADEDYLRRVYIDDQEYSYTEGFPDKKKHTFSLSFLGSAVFIKTYVDKGEYVYGLAFSVTKYDTDDGHITAVWLKTETLPKLATIRSDSTHHSIERGKHVWKSNAYMGVLLLCTENENENVYLKPGGNVSLPFVSSKEDGETMRLQVRLFQNRDLCKVFALKNEQLIKGEKLYRRGYTSLKQGNTGGAGTSVRMRYGERVRRYDIRLQMMQRGTKRKGESFSVVLHAYTYEDENGRDMINVKWI